MRNNDVALSKVEMDILRFITLDYSNKEIAQRLFISVSTVKWYIRNIYEKMNVHSRVQASVLAYKNGLFE